MEKKAVERKVLVELYNACGGSEWRDRDNWCSDEIIGKWKGVTTYAHGMVTELNLDGSYENFLRGTLPSSIGQLSKLITLDLHRNKITGPIPSTIGNCVLLRTLDLSYNEITGHIPSTIGNCVLLTKINLTNNKLTGCIPSTIGNCVHLTYLNVENNKFTDRMWPESMINCNRMLHATGGRHGWREHWK